jgi:hypothetical protein
MYTPGEVAMLGKELRIRSMVALFSFTIAGDNKV